ncbi:MAG: hypothetical protein ACE5MB_07205 [Anaerolineae bacterium]
MRTLDIVLVGLLIGPLLATLAAVILGAHLDMAVWPLKRCGAKGNRAALSAWRI